MQKENQRNFQTINSYLFIGFDKIKNIVFPSISLNKSWLQTNKTLTNQKISIIASQKSTITLLSSQIVSFHKETEKTIKIKAKKMIKYKNLFLIISLNVFKAMFNININYIINYYCGISTFLVSWAIFQDFFIIPSLYVFITFSILLEVSIASGAYSMIKFVAFQAVSIVIVQ
jgi:hypothetical protein